MSLTAPEPLTAHHITTAFACGVESLDHWLKHRALRNQVTGASRTFVVCQGEDRVVAYYALASSAVAAGVATGRMRRNLLSRNLIILAASRAQRLGVAAGIWSRFVLHFPKAKHIGVD